MRKPELNGIIDLSGQRDLGRANAMAENMLAEARRAGSTWAENRALVSAATIAVMQGDFDGAQALLEQAVEVARGAGDAWSLAMTLVPLGDLERSRPSRGGPASCTTSAWHPLARSGWPGFVALADGQPAGAGQLFHQAVSAYRRAGDTRGIAECLIGLGATAAAEGRAETAVTLFPAGEATLAGIGLELWHSNQADYQHWRGMASAALVKRKRPAQCAAKLRLRL